jgi:hypothetical protein
MNNWTSTTQELPQKFGTYLVTNYKLNSYNKLEPETRAARYFPRDNEWYSESDLLEDVRYWKPLPPPYQEEA